MDPRTLLTTAVLANATLSWLMGIVMAVAPSTVGDWLGVEIDPWLRVLGFGLLVHGAAMLWVVRRASPARWVRVNLIVLGPYPILMLLVVLTGLVDAAGGRALVLADGAAIGLIGAAQWMGVRAAPRSV